MRKIKILRWTFLLIVFIPVELILVFFNSAIWIHLQPPASALLTIPKLIYPNIIDKAAIVYLVIITLAIAGIIFGNKKKLEFSRLIKTILGICLITFISSFISCVTYIEIISNTKVEYVNKPDASIDKSSKADFNTNDREYIDLGEKFATSKPKTFKLYMPDKSEKVRDVVVYLAYGNWLAVDEQEVDYLVDGLTKKGYGAAVFTGKTRKEADIVGMVQDIRAKIVYLREHANEYGIGKIYLSGGSAGANLALLASYALNCQDYESDRLAVERVKTDGVIAFYPVVDMEYNYYYFTGKTEEQKSLLDKLGDKLFSLQDVNGAKSIVDSHKIVMKMLLGGGPDDNNVKHLYDISSPIKFLSNDIPPTLFIQGNHDSMTPFITTKKMYAELKGMDADVALLELPFTEHAFDMVLPERSIIVKKVLSSIDEWLDYHKK